MNINKIMINASINGDKQTVKNMIEMGATSYISAINNACVYGHLPILKLILKKDIRLLKYAYVCACYSGYLNIIHYVLDQMSLN